MDKIHNTNIILDRIANMFIVACLFGFSILGFLLYLDMRIDPPIYNVTATSDPARPGGIARINFTYTRPYTLQVQVLDRWLICKDDTYWTVESAAPVDADWSTGTGQKTIVPIRIPDNVTPGQSCYYGSRVKYSRYILNDIVIRNPPSGVEIKIIEN
jgi:hypothetical protein